MLFDETASAVFGIASAAAWGAGDFLGGLATKRTSVNKVVVGSQFLGLVGFVLLALTIGEAMPPAASLVRGAAAGLAGALGVMALYSALAAERMGLAAPISGVLAAAIPVGVTVVIDGLPGPVTVAGFALALVAVWLVSRADDARMQVRALGLPVVAGLGFGGFIVLIANTGTTAVFWPLAAARLASLVVLMAMAFSTRSSVWPERPLWPLVAAAGLCDAGGNAFLVMAAQAGRVDVAAVLSSLYPAATVILAWWILNERLTWSQTAGLIASLVAIAAITMR